MPSGGHNKKTRRQLELAGTARKDRHGEESVEFDAGVPHRPDIVQGEALLVWNRVAPELKKIGYWRKAFEGAIVGYCLVYGKLLEEGWLPNTEWTQMRMFIQELGLGPVSSSRLSKTEGPPMGGAGDFDGF